jgi:hypothetical protein
LLLIAPACRKVRNKDHSGAAVINNSNKPFFDFSLKSGWGCGWIIGCCGGFFTKKTKVKVVANQIQARHSNTEANTHQQLTYCFLEGNLWQWRFPRWFRTG